MFAIHRPGVWEVAGVEIRGVMYHAARIMHGRIVRLVDYPDRDQALAAVDLSSS